MIVSDTQMLVYLTIRSSNTEWARAVHVKDPEWSVPFLWRSEYRNAALGQARVAGLDPAAAQAAYDRAVRVIHDREHQIDTGAVLAAADGNRITAYDLEFVVLAQSLAVPLVTFDRQVLAAFPAVAVHPSQFVT